MRSKKKKKRDMHATYTRFQVDSIYSTSKGAWAKMKIILYFTRTYGYGGT